MTCDEYKKRVIDLFQSGKATPEQWQEMASVVLDRSECNSAMTAAIDAVCFPQEERRDAE